MTQYPFVPGHEIIGLVEAVGENVKNIKFVNASDLAGVQDSV